MRIYITEVIMNEHVRHFENGWKTLQRELKCMQDFTQITEYTVTHCSEYTLKITCLLAKRKIKFCNPTSHHLIGDVLRDNRLSKCEILELASRDGPNTSQKRRVSSAPADTTVSPSGLCKI